MTASRLSAVSMFVGVGACQVHLDAQREGFACNADATCERDLTCVASVCVDTPTTSLSCEALGGTACAATDNNSLCGHAELTTPDVDDCCPDDACLDTSTKLIAEVPHALRPPPVIDGDTSDWVGAARIPLTKVQGTPPTSLADFSVQFAVRWDATALCVLIEVTDDVWNPAGDSAAWEDDVGEVFLATSSTSAR